ncbi:ANKRD50 [Mytilus coruscus]|uniref:ANKRD50 n=1 Tax=Mytilus coruscus TaxID=42192 RepID=A0A6J8E0Y8_MYTCO|nr:ANKRD50 [Mytilus coruscus]
MATGISSRESNYIKIGLLIYKISQRAVRLKFDDEFHPDCLQATIKREIDKLRKLQSTNRIDHHQWTLLFPLQGKPSSEEFDITLMICLIRNLTDLEISNNLPFPTRVSIGDDLSRIHHYRNKIAHTNSFIIEDTDFNNYWEDIAQALQRLCGSSFTEEVIALKEMPTSESRKEDGLQFIHIQNRLTDVEEKLVEVTDKLRLIEAHQNGPLPKHIRDLFAKEINNWKKDDEKFFETSASRKILDVVKKNTFTIISGSSGMGKTAIAHHIALHLQEHEGYHILPISDPNDIETCYSQGHIQVLVIDDICGIYSVEQYLINLWERVSNKIRIFLKENKNFRILVTCRLQIAKNPHFERLSKTLNMTECSLPSKDFSSNYVESLKIASIYMNQEHILKLSREIINGLDMFPFLCGMFGKSENKDFKMFECPIHYFEEQFDQMRYKNEGCFLGLALKEDIMEILLQNKWPLYLSSVNGCCNLIKFLLERQASDIHPNAGVTTTHKTNFCDERSFEISTEDMFLDFDFRVWNEYRIKQKNAPLVAACEKGYFEIVQTLVKFGYDIDFVNPNLKSPLMAACYYGHADIMKYLLGCNCNVDLGDNEGQTALHIACREGNIEIVSLLLERGCIINKQDLLNQTPLIRACKYANLDVVKILLEYDCEINACDNKISEIRLLEPGQTSHKDIMEVTIKEKCDVNIIDAIGRTALHEACCKEAFDEENEPESIEDDKEDTLSDNSVVKHYKDTSKDASPNCYELIRKGIVELLIQNNVNIGIADWEGYTALHRAAESGYPTVVDVLLKEIIEKNLMSSLNADNSICLNKSPIQPIFVSGSKSVVNVFLQHNCDINIKDADGRNALHYASENSTLEVVEFLHTNGCNMNVVDLFGKSVIHAAYRGGSVDIIEYFLMRGCDIDHVDNEGETSYFRAFRQTDIEVIDILMKYNCDVNISKKRGQNALEL